jgi:hypothetical protein
MEDRLVNDTGFDGLEWLAPPSVKANGVSETIGTIRASAMVEGKHSTLKILRISAWCSRLVENRGIGSWTHQGEIHIMWQGG